MAYELRTDGKHLGYDDPSEDDDVHSFGILDLYGDLDAYYLVQNLTGGKTISAVMSSYFNSNLTDKFRAKFLLRNRFPVSVPRRRFAPQYSVLIRAIPLSLRWKPAAA